MYFPKKMSYNYVTEVLEKGKNKKEKINVTVTYSNLNIKTIKYK